MAADTSYVDIEDFEAALAASWGERVGRRRTQLGISQARLAELVGLTQTHISRIERGETLPREGLKSALAFHLRARRLGDLFPQPRTVAPVRARQGSAA